MPGWAIVLGACILFILLIVLGAKSAHNAPMYNAVSPHGEGVDQTDGGYRELIRKRNSKVTRFAVMALIAMLVVACGLLFGAAPARKVQAALWPTATPTASMTPTALPTRTLKPTLAYTTTPRNTGTPTATQTGLATQTARIVYQQGSQSIVTQIVSVQRTVLVQQTVLVPMTVIVFQTVMVTPTETATETPTETATASESPTVAASPTETPTPSSE